MLTPNQEQEKKEIERKNELEYDVRNIVVRGTLSIKEHSTINLNKILTTNPKNSRYDPEGNFPGLVMKIEKENIRGTGLIFTTGSLILTGIKTEAAIDPLLDQIIKNIEKTDITITDSSTEVVNIVASGTIHQKVNLDKAALVMEQTMFEPEVFAGLIRRMRDPKIVFILFSTGSFVGTGTRSRETLRQGVLKLNDEIRSKNLFYDPNRYANESQEFAFI